jgi:D-alanyl-lipoteichoic acid acyltransferase DltB (MBOAT superfamily)
LPGKRSKVFTYVNLVITMVIGGLWHGASWNFVVWGALHGVGLAAVRLWQARFGSAKATGVQRYVNIVLTFHFVAFAWIFFRAPSFDVAMAILGRIASLTFSIANVSGPLALVLAVGIAAHYLPKKWYEWSIDVYVRAPFYAQAGVLALLVLGLQNVVSTGSAPFIYTKF